MRSAAIATLLLIAAPALADVTIVVPDGSHVSVTPGGGSGGGGGGDGGGGGGGDGGGGEPPPGGGGGGEVDPNAPCLENLHAERMYDHGKLWTMGGPLGTSAIKDGVMVGGGGSQFVCHGGNILMRGDDTSYYTWNGNAWIGGVPDPTTGQTWPLTGVTGTSPNGTRGFSATDSYGHKWTFCNSTKVCRDGALTGGDGSEMLFYNNGIYILGGDHSWYIWTGATFWPWGPDPSKVTPPPTFGPVVPTPGGGSGGGGGGGDGSGSGGANSLPVPPPPAIVPGSSGHTLNVPAGGDVAAVLATAQPGDTVALAAGTYRQSVGVPSGVALVGPTPARGRSPIAVFDCAGVSLFHSKGCIVTLGDAKIANVEIKGAGMNESASGGTGGIRPDGDGWVYVDGVYAHDNQDGLFGGSDRKSAWDIKNTILEHNGLGDGLSHNAYISSGKIVVSGLTSRNPNVGHAFKIRGQDSAFTDSTLDGGNDGDALDLPDGGRHVLTNTTLRKPAGAGAHNVLRYGEESQKYGIGQGVTVTGGAVEALCESPKIVATGPVAFSGTTFSGNPVQATGGGTVTGLPGSRKR